ncbi:hypothetical protein FO519_003132 [Halicephalobus sp. NKZ332]|nr:hypothetical protein FO519_003132 [Halicephalobus sp. NKZ332]
MNTKVVVFLLVCLIYTAQAGGPFCSLCTKIIDGIKKDFNNDFSNVTKDQLESDADKQCDANANGIEASMCKSIMKQDSDQLLTALKAGQSSQQCCAQGGMC